MYYIPQLHSSIVSIEKLDKRGCKVLIESGILKIRDQERLGEDVHELPPSFDELDDDLREGDGGP